jgi:hypothetical protein
MTGCQIRANLRSFPAVHSLLMVGRSTASVSGFLSPSDEVTKIGPGSRFFRCPWVLAKWKGTSPFWSQRMNTFAQPDCEENEDLITEQTEHRTGDEGLDISFVGMVSSLRPGFNCPIHTAMQGGLAPHTRFTGSVIMDVPLCLIPGANPRIPRFPSSFLSHIRKRSSGITRSYH